MERFWSKTKRVESGCLEWQASCFKTGYGQFSVGPQKFYAHRYSYMAAYGSHIPKGWQVHHCCDNKRCVAPEHLILGTDSDNKNDMLSRSRQAVGRANAMTKLSPQSVEAIRAKYVPRVYTQYQLAQEYGVTQGHISDILKGRRRHGSGIPH